MIAAVYRTVPPNNPCMLCGFDWEMANTRRLPIITNNPKDLVCMSVKLGCVRDTMEPKGEGCPLHKAGGGLAHSQKQDFLILTNAQNFKSNLLVT